MVGDNVTVTRACAATRRAPADIMDILDRPLVACHAAGWNIVWVCARRRENGEAHALAEAARDMHASTAEATWY